MSDNNPREWTVMVYFSADNDLQDEAFNNLSQMIKVGGTDKVHVLAQLDARSDIPTRRYFMRGPNDASIVSQKTDTDRPNTDKVKDLVEFVEWASSGEHKADNYFIVLWGHGSGIFDDENDVDRAKSKGQGRKAPAGDRPLTSFELNEAFKQIRAALGKKVAILGMDACLMSMAEIAQQVSDSVELMVASEEVIPDKSWPYDRILQKLTEKTDARMEPEELAEVIVKEYVDCYFSADDPVTLSACRLEQTVELAETLDQLSLSLKGLLKIEELRKVVNEARRETQTFQFRDYVDLYNFCEKLGEKLKTKRFKLASKKAPALRKAKAACEMMMEVIEHKNGDGTGFVSYSGTTSGRGGTLANAHGVSLYFPPIPATYAELSLSKSTNWNNFLHAYMNAVFRPNKVREKKVGATSPPGVSGEFNGSPRYAVSQNGHFYNMATAAMTGNISAPRDEIKPRILLPKGTQIYDVLGKWKDKLTGQAFLIMGASAEIRVPKDLELMLPRKGGVKASTGTPVKASTGTPVKLTATLGGEVLVLEMDVPACTLIKPFSGGVARRLRNGTKIKSPHGGEPIIVIDEVKFVSEEQGNGDAQYRA